MNKKINVMIPLLSIIGILLIIPASSYEDGNQAFDITNIYKNNYIHFGTTVSFYNNDLIPHSLSGIDSHGNIISSGIIEPGQTVDLSFSKIGVFTFFDSLNNQNLGSIQVYNSLNDIQNFQTNTNGYANKISPTFTLESPQQSDQSQTPPVVTPPVVTPPVENNTNTNSTNQTSISIINQTNGNTNSTNQTSISIINQTNGNTNNIGGTSNINTNQNGPITYGSNSDNPNSIQVNQTTQQEEIQQLNDKIDALQSKIDSMSTTQDSIFGMLTKIINFDHIS